LTPNQQSEKVVRFVISVGGAPMALGDGIRRNIASIDPAERAMLRDALTN
jgi:hypothetical protein